MKQTDDIDNKLYFNETVQINDEADETYFEKGILDGISSKNAVLFGADCKEYDMDKSMQELTALAEAAGMEVVAQIVQNRTSPDKATFLGEGRLLEGRIMCKNLGAEIAIFDAELSGTHIRNLEEILEIQVIDRTMLILQIFASRAKTGEGKLQTELATLQYTLPRLSGLGVSLSRQGGGGGGGGGARRGAGESKLEYDRRHIRGRIDALKGKLKHIAQRREQTRRGRKKNGVPVIALVGYTNVGKSSLLNKMCGAEVLEANMLFATLDSTARKLRLKSGLSVILIDTVGFVSRLPHNLVNAFKSTLEEAAHADLLIKVCDASDAESDMQMQVTNTVLAELGCEDIPEILVYNKSDCAKQVLPFETSAILTSAKTGAGIDSLLLKIDDLLSASVRNIRVILPYDKAGISSIMRKNGSVTKELFTEDGVYIEGCVKVSDLHIFENYITDENL